VYKWKAKAIPLQFTIIVFAFIITLSPDGGEGRGERGG
jgi:hypothetical protein